jgi:toxin ParE1/3/4
MHKLTYTRAALSDLDAIGDFIAADSPTRALAYVEEIRSHCRRLCQHPHLGPAREGLGQGIRVLPFKRRVLIAYRVLPDAIRIVRVYYAGQEQ